MFSNCYPMHDRTGVSDYIHVVHLAKSHVEALKAIVCGFCIAVIDMGTGHSYSVLIWSISSLRLIWCGAAI